MSLNRVLEQGRLVADPNLRKTQTDRSVASFRIAVDRDRPNRETGEREADFFDVVAWSATADFVAKYFAKGDAIIVDGRLQARSWQDKDGNNRTSIEIIADNIYFGSSKKDGGGQTQPSTHSVHTQRAETGAISNDDDLPF